MSKILTQLRDGLVVSCQPVAGGQLDRPDIVAGFALAALDGGALGLRIEGAANLRTVREITNVPIIGIIKTDREDTAVRITSTVKDVSAAAQNGADIIAFDCTARDRPESLESLVSAIHGFGKLAMADCSNIEDATTAMNFGCDILGSTMSGYVGEDVPTAPDLELVKDLSSLDKFIIAEGRFNKPELAAQAILAGANAVVVGSAITRPEHITSWFAEEISAAKQLRNSRP